MAINSSRSSRGINTLHVLLVLLALNLLIVPEGYAYQFKVGGSQGWTAPNDPDTYNKWAEKNRFQIGDTLFFTYPRDKDSLLLVNKEDYDNCNTASYIKKYTDGQTILTFDRSGPYYFISGVKENCHKNEKMVVVVMADRSHGSSNSIPVSSIILVSIGISLALFIPTYRFLN